MSNLQKVVPFPRERSRSAPAVGKRDLRCRLGWHDYSQWREVFRQETLFALVVVQECQCKRCRLVISKRRHVALMEKC